MINFSEFILNIPDPVIIYNFKRKIINCNSELVRLFDYENQNEIIGKNLSFFILPEDYENFNKLIENITEKDILKNIECTFINNNREKIVAEITTSIIKNNDNNQKIFISILRDKTESKKNEENLQNSNKHMRTMLDALPDLMFELDKEGRIIDYRAPLKIILYASPDKFIGKKMSDVIPHDASEVIKNAMDLAIQKGLHSGSIYSLDLPEGKLWFELSVSYEEASNHFIILIRDITSHINSEESLKKSQASLNALIENTSDRIWAIDKEYKIIIINNNFKRDYEIAFGVKLDKGTASLLSLPENMYLVWKDRYDRALKGEHFFIEEHFDINGVPAFTEIAFNPIITDNGVLGVSCFSRDITERKLAEEELKKRAEELELFNKIMIEREMRIIELKKENNALNKEFNKKIKYPEIWDRESI